VLSFKSLNFLALLAPLYFIGLWLLFCFKVIEFFRKFLLLDKLFLSKLFIEICFDEESYLEDCSF